jgi:hypothetical protein
MPPLYAACHICSLRSQKIASSPPPLTSPPPQQQVACSRTHTPRTRTHAYAQAQAHAYAHVHTPSRTCKYIMRAPSPPLALAFALSVNGSKTHHACPVAPAAAGGPTNAVTTSSAAPERTATSQSTTPATTVCENRGSPLLVYGLIGASVLAPSMLRMLPGAVVDGILAFVGLHGLLHGGNQLVARIGCALHSVTLTAGERG